MSPQSFDTDVLVVGAGPAGLATAIAARSHGLRVTVVDAAAVFPTDKCCGEGLLPDGVAALRELGVALPVESGRFRGISFFNEGHAAHGIFAGGAAGFGIRRTLLHRLLLDRAQACGADCRFQTHVTPAMLDACKSQVRWIVGADGFRSRVRTWAGLDPAAPKTRFGFRRHFEMRKSPPPETVEVHWANDFQIFVTPVGPREAGIAMTCADPSLRLDAALQRLPQLRDRLGEPVSSERGAITGNLTLPRVWRDNVALVGDASGAVDSITGEGLHLAFRQALALASAIAADNLRPYEQTHRRLAAPPRAMAHLLLWLARHRTPRHAAVRLLSTFPAAFGALLAAHSQPPSTKESHEIASDPHRHGRRDAGPNPASEL